MPGLTPDLWKHLLLDETYKLDPPQPWMVMDDLLKIHAPHAPKMFR